MASNAFTRHLNKPLLGKYHSTPFAIFRVNPKPAISLRNRETQRSLGLHSFDVELAPDGLVNPRPGLNFLGPNGATMRPMGFMLHSVVRNFRPNCVIYRIPKDTVLPDTLMLLHEHTDHFSMQTTKPVELGVLSKQITDFLWEKTERMTQGEFRLRHPYDTSKGRLLRKGKIPITPRGDEYDWIS